MGVIVFFSCPLTLAEKGYLEEIPGSPVLGHLLSPQWSRIYDSASAALQINGLPWANLRCTTAAATH